MIANSAFLAAMLMILLVFWIMDQLAFLAPYRHAILPRYGTVLLGAALLLFLNLFAVIYTLGRALFLKDTGRKLAHVDRQLQTPDTVVRDLSAHLARED